MTKLVSFSAGLDSTWIMHKLLVEAPRGEAAYVRPAYFSMYNGGNANFIELLFGTAILQRLFENRGDQSYHTRWQTLDEANFQPVLNHNHPNSWQPLIQQGNVVMGLTKLMHRLTRRQYQSCAYVGWNKADALENSMAFGDWSLEEYARLKRLYSEIMYFQDHPGRIPPLQTPAWNMDKREMWDALPTNVQELIQVGNYNNYEFHHDRYLNKLWIVLYPNDKFNYYRKMGIEVQRAWVVTLDDAYRAWCCSDITKCISTMGLDVPKSVRFRDIGGRQREYSISEETPRLEINAVDFQLWEEIKACLNK